MYLNLENFLVSLYFRRQPSRLRIPSSQLLNHSRSQTLDGVEGAFAIVLPSETSRALFMMAIQIHGRIGGTKGVLEASSRNGELFFARSESVY